MIIWTRPRCFYALAHDCVAEAEFLRLLDVADANSDIGSVDEKHSTKDHEISSGPSAELRHGISNC